MLERCYLAAHKSYPDYGGRGIEVCARWLTSYEAFKLDMGDRPAGTTLGRIDNDVGYTPSNCRWETYKQQARNRRSSVFLTFRGRTMSVPEWSQELCIPYTTLSKRLADGWSVDDALTRPLKPDCRRVARYSLRGKA